MSPETVGIIGIAIAVALLFIRIPVGLVFAIIGFIGTWYLSGLTAILSAIGTIPYATVSNSVYTTIPLFIFMGYLASETNLAQEFYAGFRKWVGHLRGGLAMAVIIGNAGFGAVSGNSTAAAVTFTAISLPEMRKYGYADTLIFGSISAGALLAPLIPPSIGFIIYGSLTAVSIGELFVAGIGPGIILALLYVLTIAILCRINPDIGPTSPNTTFKEKLTASSGMWILVLMFLAIIGGIYLGVFTPTEAGAVGAFFVLVIGLIRRRLNSQKLLNALRGTGHVWGMVALLIVGVMVFNLFLVNAGVPQAIATFLTSMTSSPVVFLLIVIVIYFILGCFMDGMAIVLLTIPILFPVSEALGVNPLVFGVIAVMCMDIGAITPPYGIIAFTIAGMVKDVSLFKIFRGVAPFIIASVIIELLVIFVPDIVTFLPGTMH